MLGASNYTSKLIVGFLLLFTVLAAGKNLQQAIEDRLPGLKTALASPGTDGWYFPAEEFHFLGEGPFWGDHAGPASKAPSPDLADPLPAILDFHAQLKDKNVTLILVPIPPKLLVYPDKLEQGLPTVAASSLSSFYEVLRQHEIQVLDLLPVFQEERTRQEKPIYCKTDSHYSGYGCVVTAESITKAIQSHRGSEPPAPSAYTTEWKPVDISGDLAPKGTAPESVDLRFVGSRHDQGLLPVETDRDSEVLLLGDSHCLVFSAGGDMHTEGAGLADQLAYTLGRPVDLLGVRGSGSTPSRLSLFRRAKRDPDYWGSKSIVIWCFAAREFTESPTGWRPLPVSSE